MAAGLKTIPMFRQLKIVIAGGSGFMGSAMAARWASENSVTILSRQQRKGSNNSYLRQATRVSGVQYLYWDGQTLGPWAAALDGADLLINLTGKSVNCRYHAANRAAILNSRVTATSVLGAAVQQCVMPPALWVNASSATIYRHAEDRPQDEATGEQHNDFSVQVCKAWESTFNAITLPHTRKAILRSAIVLGRGGVLVPYARLARLGLGGPQGSGRQMFSWIHIVDVCRILEWLWDHPEQDGVFNASAPGPVTNTVFMHDVRKALGIPFGLPAPEGLLRLGGRIIGTEPELLLKSRWVLPSRLLAAGFDFSYPDLPAALHHLLCQPQRSAE